MNTSDSRALQGLGGERLQEAQSSTEFALQQQNSELVAPAGSCRAPVWPPRKVKPSPCSQALPASTWQPGELGTVRPCWALRGMETLKGTRGWVQTKPC